MIRAFLVITTERPALGSGKMIKGRNWLVQQLPARIGVILLELGEMASERGE